MYSAAQGNKEQQIGINSSLGLMHGAVCAMHAGLAL